MRNIDKIEKHGWDILGWILLIVSFFHTGFDLMVAALCCWIMKEVRFPPPMVVMHVEIPYKECKKADDEHHESK